MKYCSHRSQCEMKFAHIREANISHLRSKYFTAKLFHLPARANFVEISTCNCKCFFLAGIVGLEPTKCKSQSLVPSPTWLYPIINFSKKALKVFTFKAFCVSIELSSRLVSKQVLLPLQSLTSVFGMGTGGPFAFETLTM